MSRRVSTSTQRFCTASVHRASRHVSSHAGDPCRPIRAASSSTCRTKFDAQICASRTSLKRGSGGSGGETSAPMPLTRDLSQLGYTHEDEDPSKTRPCKMSQRVRGSHSTEETRDETNESALDLHCVFLHVVTGAQHNHAIKEPLNRYDHVDTEYPPTITVHLSAHARDN